MNTTDLTTTPLQDHSSLNSIHIPRMTISLILAIPCIVFNVLLLVTFYRDPHRDLRNRTSSLLVVNLCVCDLLTGLLPGLGGASYDIVVLATAGRARENLRIVAVPIVFVSFVTTIVGSCTTVAMVLERWIVIKYPLQYRTNDYTVQCKVFIAAVWIYSFLFSSLYAIGVPPNIVVLLYCHLHVSLPVLILAVVLWNVRRAVFLQNNQIRDVVNGAGAQMELVQKNRERKVTVAFFLVVILFYITFTPQSLLHNIRIFCSLCAGTKEFLIAVEAADRFTLLNSVLDPFIYAWRIPKYRRAFTSIFCNFYYVRRRRNNQTAPIDVNRTWQEQPMGDSSTQCIEMKNGNINHSAIRATPEPLHHQT